MEMNRLLSQDRSQGASVVTKLEEYVPRSRYGMIPDPSEIEVAQLMVSMSCQKPFLPTPATTVPPPLRTTFIYHTPTPTETSDLVYRRGRRSGSPRKLVMSPSRTPCPNCGTESSTLWRSCDVCRHFETCPLKHNKLVTKRLALSV
eukprot:TRINITY_DN5308_c0_g1_i1.p1 TRINITY_DN5308_c0_g1~~TRINITY_DN5308_c0_g1_i1.p1  ORF type:complete len:146 (+),score=19.64 TRINITY_DN5308_c0_g1_i1:109-546(+)